MQPKPTADVLIAAPEAALWAALATGSTLQILRAVGVARPATLQVLHRFVEDVQQRYPQSLQDAHLLLHELLDVPPGRVGRRGEAVEHEGVVQQVADELDELVRAVRGEHVVAPARGEGAGGEHWLSQREKAEGQARELWRSFTDGCVKKNVSGGSAVCSA